MSVFSSANPFFAMRHCPSPRLEVDQEILDKLGGYGKYRASLDFMLTAPGQDSLALGEEPGSIFCIIAITKMFMLKTINKFKEWSFRIENNNALKASEIKMMPACGCVP